MAILAIPTMLFVKPLLQLKLNSKNKNIRRRLDSRQALLTGIESRATDLYINSNGVAQAYDSLNGDGDVFVSFYIIF